MKKLTTHSYFDLHQFFCCLIVLGSTINPCLATEASRYIDKLDTVSFPATDPIKHPVDIHWDFSRGKRYTYDVSENAIVTSKTRGLANEGTRLDSITMVGNGTMVLASLFDKKARLTMNSEYTMDAILPDGSMQTTSETLPSHVIDDFSSKGKFTARERLDFTIEAWMRLPDKPVQAGDTVSIPVRQPVNINYAGTDLMMEGRLEILLAGFVNCHEHRCAELHSSILIEKYTPPENISGSFDVFHLTRGKTYFDLDDQKLIEHIEATRSRVDAELPGKNKNKGLPDDHLSTHAVVESDSLVHIIYRDVSRSQADKLTIRKYRRGDKTE